MAKLIYALNQSLDGYIDHTKFAPSRALFLHFLEQMQGLAGVLYGRGMYEVMRYWDEDQAGWDAAESDFARAWRRQPKWVASRTLRAVGPNATLIGNDLEKEVRRLKTEVSGEIEVAGSHLAHSLTELGLIDEYQLYLHPVVLGEGQPYFAGRRSPLRLVGSDRIDGQVIRLTYVPA